MDSIEGVAICNIVSDDDSVGTLVVTGCDCLKSLLASCIPNLQLANFVIAVDGSDLEVHANGWHKVLLKVVILKEKRPKHSESICTLKLC